MLCLKDRHFESPNVEVEFRIQAIKCRELA